MRLRQHARMHAVGDDRGHRRNQLGRVLIIRVDHDDDVRARFEREAITGLLVAAVAGVFLMHMHAHAEQRRRHLHRVVAAAVIHQDDFVHDALLEDFVHGLGDSFGRVVSGHDHDDFFSVIHLAPEFPAYPAGINRCFEAKKRIP